MNSFPAPERQVGESPEGGYAQSGYIEFSMSDCFLFLGADA